MKLKAPENLQFGEPDLRLTFENSVRVNRTNCSIIIEGNRDGFLTLANQLIFFINDLEQSIDLSSLDYINSEIEFLITIDDDVFSETGVIERESENGFKWRVSEENASLFATCVHSLGHLNPELHWDRDTEEDDISLYCVVS